MADVLVIKPQTTWWKINIRELWNYRELLYILTWRDVKVRYKQTVLGVFWVVIQPLATTGIFSIFFGQIAKIPSDGMPYPLFVFLGLTLWNFFSSGVSAASNSILSNQGLVQKIYFPRIIILASAILTSGVDFLVSFCLLIVALLFYGYIPNIGQVLIFFPIIFLLLFMLMLGIGMLSSSVNVKYRDVRYLLPFAIQLGLYVSPIIYPYSAVTGFKKTLLAFNPLTGIIEAYRSVLTNTPVNLPLLGIAAVVCVVFFVAGLWYFRQVESYFADIA